MLAAWLRVRFAGMRTFLIVWAGQTVSRFGSYMTFFGLMEIWLWQQTERASALAIVGIIAVAGGLVASLVGGVIVDRFSRKTVMIAADAIAALGTVAFLLLLLADQLAIWHLYAASGLIMMFNQLHGLAYSASVTMMVDKSQYARAGSLRFLTHYGAVIFAPPLAAVLYGTLGLEAIMIVDLVTVLVAIGTVIMVEIPEPPSSKAGRESRMSRRAEVVYGFRYIRRSPSLMALLVALLIFEFFHDMSVTVHAPMILARTGGNVNVMAAVGTAAGLGGLAGATVMTAWGGPRRQIKAWLWGTVGAGLAKMLFSLGRNAIAWFPAQFGSSFNFPIRGGSLNGILLAKVEPDVQGRFFAAVDMSAMGIAIVARAIAAPFSDYVLEPGMASDGALAQVGLLQATFGTGPGAGFALLYFGSAFVMMLVGMVGFRIRALYNIEDLLTDHDLQPETEVSETASQEDTLNQEPI